ncbi:hypothetical protein THH46_04050 [Pseudomonas sp. NA13]
MNLQTVYSMSGKTLLLDNIDAGWRLYLPGDAGQISHCWDQRGTYRRTTYDTQLRMTAIHEQAAGEMPRRVECLHYGDSSPASALHNRCGALIRHDDSAGTLLIHEYALCAKPSARPGTCWPRPNDRTGQRMRKTVIACLKKATATRRGGATTRSPRLFSRPMPPGTSSAIRSMSQASSSLWGCKQETRPPKSSS